MERYLQLLEESLPDPSHPRYSVWRDYALTGEKRAAPIIEELGLTIELSSSRVLDVGCGEGGLTVVLAESGARAVAVDIDPSRVERTSARLRWRGTAASVLVAAAESLPFESSSFDAVIVQDVIEHVADSVRVIRECARVLRVGGVCLVYVANGLAWANILADPHWGLFGLSLMPRWLASFYVCKIRRRAPCYDVWHLPNRRNLRQWIVLSGLNVIGEERRFSFWLVDSRNSVISIVACKPLR